MLPLTCMSSMYSLWNKLTHETYTMPYALSCDRLPDTSVRSYSMSTNKRLLNRKLNVEGMNVNNNQSIMASDREQLKKRFILGTE